MCLLIDVDAASRAVGLHHILPFCHLEYSLKGCVSFSQVHITNMHNLRPMVPERVAVHSRVVLKQVRVSEVAVHGHVVLKPLQLSSFMFSRGHFKRGCLGSYFKSSLRTLRE